MARKIVLSMREAMIGYVMPSTQTSVWRPSPRSSPNPAVGADKPTLQREAVQAWEPEHVRTFLRRCGEHRLGALFEVAVLTGLRREITGLRWSDINLIGRKIVVRRSKVAVNGNGHEQSTKTRVGLRTSAVQLRRGGVAGMAAAAS